MTLLAFAAVGHAGVLLLGARPRSNRSISPAHRTHSIKPAGRMMGQTDRQTDARQFLDYARSVSNCVSV